MIVAQCRSCWAMLEGKNEMLSHKCPGSPVRGVYESMKRESKKDKAIKELISLVNRLNRDQYGSDYNWETYDGHVFEVLKGFLKK